jgi:GNAT superfamily N-acetyltransferase
MNPILRSAKPSDLSTLNQFQQRLVNHERPFDPGIPREGEVKYYDIEELIEADNTNLLVVESENRIIGCGFGQIKKNLLWATNKDYGYVGLMFVDEGFRKQNIGKLIVEALIDWFKEKNISDIRIKVYKNNAVAVEAYKSYGFNDFVLELQYKPE